jgi:phosphatidylglycerol lysyltransferase
MNHDSRLSTSKTETHSRAGISHPIFLESSPVERFAYHHGRVYDSYLACETDREQFWLSDRTGVVTYVKIGKHLKVGGGLLAAEKDKSRLLQEFLEHVRKKFRSAVFFNITDDDLPHFRRQGLQVTKWGEDALIDLDMWNCQGKAYEWIRRQRNYCIRQKVRCEEWRPENCSVNEYLATRDELLVVSKDSLKSKPQCRELRFFEGRLDFDNLGRQRFFLARSNDGFGRIEAFIVAIPYDSGKGWAFEMYRHRQDAIRGVVPYLKLATMEQLRSEGVEQVSLCLIPGLNCGSASVGDSRLIRNAISLGKRFVNPIFDLSGIYHYKSRFRPRLESRYVCAFPRSNVMTMITSMYLLGVFFVAPSKVISHAWRQIINQNRKSLAKTSRELE